MSFHTQEFHETKRERKYYEGKKQDALRIIRHLIEGLKDDIIYETPLKNKHGQSYDGDLKYTLERVEYIYKLVNKI